MKPKRKINRLTEYDYAQNGAYFITICAREKKKVFGRVVGGGVLDAPRVYHRPPFRVITRLSPSQRAVNTADLHFIPIHRRFIPLCLQNLPLCGTLKPTQGATPTESQRRMQL